MNDGLRIGDAEREEAARELGEHFALGRITAEEHSERLEQVWAARTKADLAPAFRDLPRPQVRRPAQAAARERRTHPRFELPYVPFPLKVLLGIVLIWWGFHHLLFLVLGCFLDTAVMLLVFVPMLLPAAKLLGVDLVHFGVVVVINMMIGLVTPPFGMLLFVTNALTGIPIKAMLREGWLFLAMLMGLLLLLTLVPQIVLWLPQTMGYGLK